MASNMRSLLLAVSLALTAANPGYPGVGQQYSSGYGGGGYGGGGYGGSYGYAPPPPPQLYAGYAEPIGPPIAAGPALPVPSLPYEKTTSFQSITGTFGNVYRDLGLGGDHGSRVTSEGYATGDPFIGEVGSSTSQKAVYAGLSYNQGTGADRTPNTAPASIADYPAGQGYGPYGYGATVGGAPGVGAGYQGYTAGVGYGATPTAGGYQAYAGGPGGPGYGAVPGAGYGVAGGAVPGAGYGVPGGAVPGAGYGVAGGAVPGAGYGVGGAVPGGVLPPGPVGPTGAAGGSQFSQLVPLGPAYSKSVVSYKRSAYLQLYPPTRIAVAGVAAPSYRLAQLDDISKRFPLKCNYNFLGRLYNEVWVNSNGVLSFDGALIEYKPTQEFPLKLGPLIAPFWTDVWTGACNKVDSKGNKFQARQCGEVFYYEANYAAGTPSDEVILSQATRDVHTYFPQYQDFSAQCALVVTWQDVLGTSAAFGRPDVAATLTANPTFLNYGHVFLSPRNSFQVALISDNQGRTFLLNMYKIINWAEPNTLVGFDDGYGLFYNQVDALGQPVSFTSASLYLDEQTNLATAPNGMFGFDFTRPIIAGPPPRKPTVVLGAPGPGTVGPAGVVGTTPDGRIILETTGETRQREDALAAARESIVNPATGVYGGPASFVPGSGQVPGTVLGSLDGEASSGAYLSTPIGTSLPAGGPAAPRPAPLYAGSQGAVLPGKVQQPVEKQYGVPVLVGNVRPEDLPPPVASTADGGRVLTDAPAKFSAAAASTNTYQANEVYQEQPVAQAYQGAPAPAYQGAPAPAYQGAPAPAYQGTPAPAYQGAPAPAYQGTPAPAYQGTPAHAYQGAPAPAYQGAPAPAYQGAPAPAYQGAPAPAYQGAPAPAYQGQGQFKIPQTLAPAPYQPQLQGQYGQGLPPPLQQQGAPVSVAPPPPPKNSRPLVQTAFIDPGHKDIVFQESRLFEKGAVYQEKLTSGPLLPFGPNPGVPLNGYFDSSRLGLPPQKQQFGK